MSKLNIYKIIRNNKTNDIHDWKLYISLMSKEDNPLPFIVKEYYVVAHNEDEAQTVAFPYQNRYDMKWLSTYFTENFSCHVVCHNSSIVKENWPQHTDIKGINDTNDTNCTNELLSIGYNNVSFPGNYHGCNKLSYDDIMAYINGLPQILMINMYVYSTISKKYTYQKLIIPTSYNDYILINSKNIEFIDWITKPLNQLTVRIFNKQPDESIKLWKCGLMNPNCDMKDVKCCQRICHHILNDYYCKTIDVDMMADLLILFNIHS